MSIRSRRSSTDVLSLLLAAALCLGAAAARAQETSPETVREKARAVLGQGYQQDLPGAPDDEGGDGSRAGGSHRPPGLSSPPGGSGVRTETVGAALSLLVWITLGVLGVAALVLLLTWLIRDFPAWGRRSQKARTGPAAPGAPGQADSRDGPAVTLADAERLASQERWTEAVHSLLLVAIRHLTTRFSIPQSDSRTSREIARLVPLQRESRDAFAGLVRTVEISLFGGVPVGQAEYRASLESVRRLLGSAS